MYVRICLSWSQMSIDDYNFYCYYISEVEDFN
jgi:hypothetical protein